MIQYTVIALLLATGILAIGYAVLGLALYFIHYPRPRKKLPDKKDR